MNPKLSTAVDIFKKLSWNDASPDQAATLPLGSKEQQKIAREGLAKGEWAGVKANHAMLAFYAIRVGVTPRRALQIISWDELEALTDVLSTKDEEWVQEFIRRGCSSEWRLWEHSMSRLGTIAVELVTRMDLTVPESVDYIKDWAGVVAGHLTDYPVEHLGAQVTTKEALNKKFREHLTVATTIGAPVTGPLGAVPAGAVREGWLTREEALSFAFVGIEFAVRPGDRKKWAQIITEDLAATDEELLPQTPGLIPVISTAETPMVELLGLRILPHLEGDAWGEMALIMSYATTAKSLAAVLQAMSKSAEPPADVLAMLAPRIEELTAHKNAKVAKLSKELLDAWGHEAAPVELEDTSYRYSWNPYPGFQESPRVQLPEKPSAATITPLLKHIEDEYAASSLHAELLWAQLAQLSQVDIATARRLVNGVHNDHILRFWSQGATIPHPMDLENDRRYSIRPERARNILLLRALGHQPVPCLLSQPSFEDLSIDPEDLAQRMSTYATTEGAMILLADLLLALARLRVPAEGIPELQERFRALSLPLEGIARTAGEVVADYLADPFLDPGTYPRYGYTYPNNPEIPASLADCIDLEESRGHSWRTGSYNDVSIYPLFTYSTWCYISHDEAGLDRLARFGTPLPPRVVAELLTLGEANTEYADALTRAWQRGLIVPGTWSFEHDTHNQNLRKKAESLRLAAELGALAAVWPMLDFLLGHHASKLRITAGVSDLADLALELAPVVATALVDGVATYEQAPTTGLAALAAKGGSSLAVRTARRAMDFFPKELTPEEGKQETPAPPAKLTEAEFAAAWPAAEHEPRNPQDGYAVSLALIDGPTQAKEIQVTISKGEEIYTMVNRGWFYSLHMEGQVNAKDHEGNDVWLHWDKRAKRLVATRHRNWVRKTTAPLQGPPTQLTDSFIAVIFANMQHQLATSRPDYDLRWTLGDALISAAGVSAAVDKLLESPEYNPTRTFGYIEKNPEFLPILWPLLTRCLAHAAAQEVAPRWTSRCLDAVRSSAAALATATAKGIIPAGAWEPLRVLAGTKKKSATKTKAQDLVVVLLGG